MPVVASRASARPRTGPSTLTPGSLSPPAVTGRKLAITSLPADRYPIIVERIVPSTEVKEGSTFFKVIAKFDRDSKDWPKDKNGQAVAPPWLPDMEGEARVDVAPASLGWRWTHRLIDFVRLKLWI